MPVTPLLPFPGPSCHLIRLYLRHKSLTGREVFTPGIVWGARLSRKEHLTKHLKFFCLHIGVTKSNLLSVALSEIKLMKQRMNKI